MLDFDTSLRVEQGHREAEGKISLYRGPLLLAYDRRYDGTSPDELASIVVEDSQSQVLAWDGEWPDPWLLLRVPTTTGGHVTLCDFCTAGAAGTPYRSWLPGGDASTL